MKRFIFIMVLVFMSWFLYSELIKKPNDRIATVERIYSISQEYDGEIIDELVKLGPEYINAMSVLLYQEDKFPIVYIKAIGRLGRPEGFPGLLNYIQRHKPYNDENNVDIVALAIQTIHLLQGGLDVSGLVPILDAKEAIPLIKLHAASVLSKYGSDEEKSLAENSINELFSNRYEYYRMRSKGFFQSDLIYAISKSEFSAKESFLVRILEDEYFTRNIKVIVENLGENGSAESIEALVRLADLDYGEYEFEQRIIALERLASLSSSVDRNLYSSLHAKLMRIIPENISPEDTGLLDYKVRLDKVKMLTN